MISHLVSSQELITLKPPPPTLSVDTWVKNFLMCNKNFITDDQPPGFITRTNDFETPLPTLSVDTWVKNFLS